MSTSFKQKQLQETNKAVDTENSDEWSPVRVGEGVAINVISAILVSLWAIFLGMIYGAWTLLLSALHAPDGIVGILAFILLGAVLMLIILTVVIISWFRQLKSATIVGTFLGAMIGGMIGAAIDSGKWKLDQNGLAFIKEQEQKNAAKTESE